MPLSRPPPQPSECTLASWHGGTVNVSFVWGPLLVVRTLKRLRPQAMAATDLLLRLGESGSGTTYYCRAKADGDGDPVYGEEKSFTR